MKLAIFGFERRAELGLPLYLSTVQAGFPSPAEDYIDKKLDLNEQLVRHPAATFFVRVDGDSMRDAGVASGDILVVDRAVEPRDGHIVIAALDGELTVKRLRRKNGQVLLVPENPDYAPVAVGPEASFEVWGVVTYIIHKA
ncbi:Peptidase S24/S26A/S26B, conserved region [Solidesulfovibrio fructosivorans JJ]]|uniref:Peptidase S24/S26A/S26B, conserved region n=1 Tax=Solidesulfovibrio fructosivorans JJ] TaxID=596151 RepID=E1JUI5_SOLFR|nr:translesion error-prone DNA polymerase V autoproteolytic subunit [Solidesulfovibrio fructosivorans]EFL52115.1 Peptidase S24/S26A/S26B, conserved region [Solidesulfovibrio fructosivorans JJ]]